MATERKKIDISNSPDLLRLAEEVVASRSSRLLTRGDEVMVIVTPAESAATGHRHRREASPHEGDDPILRIIGIGESPEPTDISEHKRRYVAEAYEPKES